MKYFAAFLKMKDEAKSTEHRQAHLDFVEDMVEKDYLFSYGRLTDGSGGLLIYQADSLEQATKLASADPYVELGARELSIHEWAMQSPYTFKNKKSRYNIQILYRLLLFIYLVFLLFHVRFDLKSFYVNELILVLLHNTHHQLNIELLLQVTLSVFYE